jgi:hypothetical protein
MDDCVALSLIMSNRDNGEYNRQVADRGAGSNASLRVK